MTTNRLIEAALQGGIVIFAGAGVSAGAPSSLPGWKPLNAGIFRALRLRLESALEREGWLAHEEAVLATERGADRFPPDYQAQVIEEMCGERYFRALQTLDVDVTNTGHNGIAALASAGVVRAVVTTNFDRLIEVAMDRRKVAYEAAYDANGFIRLNDRLANRSAGPLPVIKIHGSVSDHLSMIDTLKQRRKGRSRAIEDCLAELSSSYWVYLGFSAADLETDSKYLGLVEGASRSAGATYVVRPGHADLGVGAQLLMAAYGECGTVAVAEVETFLEEIGRNLHLPEWMVASDLARSGNDEFEAKLSVWASGLPLAAAGTYLAAVLEAAGQSEPAVRILDRLARKEIFEERGTPDFQLLQLQYGRLGAAFGRFINVPDLNGVISNASVESVQSLLRLQDTEYAIRAMGWLPCLYLWLNKGAVAISLAGEVMRGFYENDWGARMPQSDEEAVDAWIGATQCCLLNTSSEMLEAIRATFEEALTRAKRCGDVVRTARVLALHLVGMAETSTEDVPALAVEYAQEFRDAQRVGDSFAIGFVTLAIGRWYAGPGGLALATRIKDSKAVAERALRYLNAAVRHLDKRGMDPWIFYTNLQQAKAFSDMGDIDTVDGVIRQAANDIDRFPVLASHLHETVGQVRTMTGHPEASRSFRAAIAAADESGLYLRRDMLISHYGDRPGVMKSIPAPRRKRGNVRQKD